MLHALLWPAAADGVFTLTDRTEARVRAPDPATGAAAMDFDTQADARAIWKTRDMTYTLADLPRLALLDLNGSTRQGALVDSALATAEWHSLRARVRLSETATYGELSFESLSALPAAGTSQTAPPSNQPSQLPTATPVPPTSQSILYAASETTGSTTLNVQRVFVTAQIGYRMSGGGDAAAQQLLPFQQGLFANASADVNLGARDHLATVLSGSEASFSTGTQDIVASVEEQWRHRWLRRTQSVLGGGYSVLRSRASPDAPDVVTSTAGAVAGLDQQFAHGRDSGNVRAEVRLAPYVNPLTGLVDEQVRGVLAGTWTHRPLTVRVFASAGESLEQGTSTSLRFGTAELQVAYPVSKRLLLESGVRALYQEQNVPTQSAAAPAPAGGPSAISQSSLSQVVFFVGLSISALKVRF